tara:strand:- start:1409 stop:2218 length:810 start_codon:yes stop_codon:yes gene_type:complete
MKTIPLFWWSEVRLMHKQRENYGDLLSKYIIENFTEKPIKWIHPKKQRWYNYSKINYLSIGSIIHHSTQNSIVWGSGIIDNIQEVENADFRAVRGPQTRKFLIDKGYNCPEIYGDPALLLPDFYNPKVKTKYKLGIIPHYNDFDEILNKYGECDDVKIIDMMTLDVEKTTNEILECNQIVSSSLHGVIVSHAYGIPALWIKFSDKPFGNDIKYKDYYDSIQIFDYKSPVYETSMLVKDLLAFFEINCNLPDKNIIKQLKSGLIESCPFN